jgi:hypothetical protein
MKSAKKITFSGYVSIKTLADINLNHLLSIIKQGLTIMISIRNKGAENLNIHKVSAVSTHLHMAFELNFAKRIKSL